MQNSMNATVFIPLAILIGSAPLLFCSLHSIKKWGWLSGFFLRCPPLFSPILLHWVSFLIPEAAFSLHIYEGFNIDERTFNSQNF